MKSYLLVGCCLAVLWGCHRSDQAPEITPAADEILMTFAVSVPAAGATRASTDETIEQLDILVFDVSDAVGNPETYSYTTQPIYLQPGSSPDRMELIARVKISAQKQRFVLLANCRDEMSQLNGADETWSKDQVLSSLVYRNGDLWTSEAPFMPLPMWGESEAVTITQQENRSITIPMLRMMARVEVELDDAVDNFEIEEIQFYHVASRGRIVPDASVVLRDAQGEVAKVTAATIPAYAVSDPLILTSPLTHTVNSGSIPAFYLFESQAAPAGQEKEGTCLIVAGKYNGGSTSYYRLDFLSLDDEGNSNVYKDVMRNYRYLFHILSVGGDGYGTPSEALAASSSNLTVGVYEWNNGDIMEFVYNSQYVLGVSTRTLEVGDGAANQTILVTTDYPYGWTATPNASDAGWLSVSSTEFNGMNSKDKLVVNVGANGLTAERTGTIIVRAGTLQIPVTITQQGK